MFTPAPLLIVLNIYDIHQSNSVLYSVGAGFYHTGVEVNGYEYSFSPNGVVRTRPQLPDFGTLREQKTMGTYNDGMSGINGIISNLRNSRFHHGAYDMVHLNCNHFSDAFCLATVQQGIPSWVNRMAGMGAMASSKPSSGGSGDKMAAPGVVKAPELPVKKAAAPVIAKQTQVTQEPQPAASNSIFSWFGWGGSSTTTASAAAPIEGTAPVDPAKTAGTAAVSAPSKKKELTEKQKELLAKMKS